MWAGRGPSGWAATKPIPKAATPGTPAFGTDFRSYTNKHYVANHSRCTNKARAYRTGTGRTAAWWRRGIGRSSSRWRRTWLGVGSRSRRSGRRSLGRPAASPPPAAPGSPSGLRAAAPVPPGPTAQSRLALWPRETRAPPLPLFIFLYRRFVCPKGTRPELLPSVRLGGHRTRRRRRRQSAAATGRDAREATSSTFISFPCPFSRTPSPVCGYVPMFGIIINPGGRGLRNLPAGTTLRGADAVFQAAR